MNIYLDYAANTPVDERVMKVFSDSTLKYYANPNSTHPLGKIVKEEIDKATANILNMLKNNCFLDENMEVIYTSGASESNNLAIKGIASSYKEFGKHIITTFLEHSSVSSPITYLKEMGYDIDLLQIGEDGRVDLEHLKRLLRDDTILVSVCYVDSEVGTVQPISEIANILKDYPNCKLHVDATQAIGKVVPNFSSVDMISFTPHKFYGFNGFGALLKRKNIVLEPIINGGASTTIYRSGTPVVGQILAMEKALELNFEEFESRRKCVLELNEKIVDYVTKLDNVFVNTPDRNDNPFILNISIKGAKATEFKGLLERDGVCVSIKSACTVEITPSRIVMSMTGDRKRALGTIRISLSHLTTLEEVDIFLNIFEKVYKEIINGK